MNCEDCGKDLAGKRADARFCNDACKKRWVRKQKPPGKRGRPPKRPENELAAEVVKKVKAAKAVPEVRVPASTLLSRLTVKLPSADTRGPVPAKKKSQPKGGQES